ncbi:sporulation initiation phosphotransferase B [Radiobacillus kanasensis]|uniref:Spo0B domain-containing protein n=1 Tax=Radiobacillus kanasensis TaxID=2844358 RepID=UPI001E2B8A86|nr:sporulation initiation phosphotransferase B [Radiobacillus kanasensis]
MVELLSFYRHDWLNELQLLMGYASMDKMDKVKDKVEACIEAAKMERRISNLKMSKTALWVLSFNWYHSNFRLNFSVYKDFGDLSKFDESIHKQATEFVDILEQYSDPMEMYEGTFLIQSLDEDQTEVVLSFHGKFSNEESLYNALDEIELEKVTVEQEEEEIMTCSISWICNSK